MRRLSEPSAEGNPYIILENFRTGRRIPAEVVGYDGTWVMSYPVGVIELAPYGSPLSHEMIRVELDGTENGEGWKLVNHEHRLRIEKWCEDGATDDKGGGANSATETGHNTKNVERGEVESGETKQEGGEI